MFGRLQQCRRFGLEQLEKRELLSIGASGLLQATVFNAKASVSDDYGNTFAQAAQVSLSSAGSGSQSGKIEQAADVDMFKIVAPITGQMTIQELAASGSRIDSFLYVYDANQKLLAQNDDYNRSLNSQVVINVTAGTTYYIKAAAYRQSTGAYTVKFATTAAATDDFGNTIALATQVNLSSTGEGNQSGKIEQAGDVDMFKIVATATGTMTIKQSAASGSQLNSYLYVYDANGQLLSQNNDYGSSQNSQIQISVVAGTTYYVKAAAYQQSTGAYALSFSTAATTTTPTTPTASGFQIDVTMTGFTTAQQQIIQQAVSRWEQIIVGDLPDVTYNGRVIDDIEIAISGITIDGSGNILGQSTATAFRSSSDLPYLGYIQLDTADVATMLSNGSLLGVIEHEIAHVLGFGVIWSDMGLLVGAGTSNPGFTGANAVAAYNTIFGTNVTAVPVEADGGSGTRLSHWDETVFNNELMTGWYNSGQTNPISSITVASMADLGYTVNMAAADSYTRPTSSVVSSTSVASTSSRSCLSFIQLVSPSVVKIQSNDNLVTSAVATGAGLTDVHAYAGRDAIFSANNASTVMEDNGRSGLRLSYTNLPAIDNDLNTAEHKSSQVNTLISNAADSLDDLSIISNYLASSNDISFRSKNSDRLHAIDLIMAQQFSGIYI
jgi:hypothetical protein